MVMLPGWLLVPACCVYILHIGADLVWDFFENLIGEVSTGRRCVVLHELHDLSHASLSHIVSENSIVTIELFHGGEVGFTYAHNYD